ncbi:MAG: TldD/PmbA family protein [Candidatus Krumholzibacteriales bacterium]
MELITNLAQFAVEEAASLGAETVEAGIGENLNFSVNVRNRDVETLTESVSNHIHILVSIGSRRASSTSSDLSRESIARLAADAVRLCRIMEPDEYYRLPDRDELGSASEELQIFHPGITEMATDRKIEIARELEDIALKKDRRILIDQSAYSNSVAKIAIANSLGFCDSYKKSYNSAFLSCAAADDTDGQNRGKRQSAYWYSAAISFEQLRPLEEIASEAVKRTLRKIGGIKPKTCRVPVVFDPITAGGFLSSISSAVRGKNIYRKSSFLEGMLDQKIAPPILTVIDDPLMPGRLGSRPFDSEGVISRRNTVIEKGVLKTYLMNTYQANKLGKQTTGNSGGVSNFYIQPGEFSEEEIISSVDNGLYLTSTSGQGANWSTGDFSQGAEGIWIGNGSLSHPVSGFTIAGTFGEMLEDIDMIGKDIEWKNDIASPPFKINKMVISGS